MLSLTDLFLVLQVSAIIRLFFIFWLLSIALPVRGQFILWKEDRLLTWDDFAGKKPNKSRWAAATHSRLRYHLNRDTEGHIVFDVFAAFDPHKSWKKSKRLKPYLLQHEQDHFDIAELYARKIRKSFSRYQARHSYKYNTELRMHVIFERYFDRYRRYQHKYDRKTRHSRRKPEQFEWNEKISSQLRDLHEYRR